MNYHSPRRGQRHLYSPPLSPEADRKDLRAYIHVWAFGPHVDLHSQLFLSEAEKPDLAASPRDRLF